MLNLLMKMKFWFFLMIYAKGYDLSRLSWKILFQTVYNFICMNLTYRFNEKTNFTVVMTYFSWFWRNAKKLQVFTQMWWSNLVLDMGHVQQQFWDIYYKINQMKITFPKSQLFAEYDGIICFPEIKFWNKKFTGHITPSCAPSPFTRNDRKSDFHV